MRGEIYLGSVTALGRALRAAALAHGGDVHVDLGGVPYLGMDGARVLAEAAAELAARDRELVVHRLAPHLRRLLRMIGWDRLPGLRVHDTLRRSR